MNLIRHLFTGKDNATWDLGRISWGVNMAAVIGHEAYQLWKGAGSSIRDFAMALAVVAGAHGIALGLKAKTEPGGEA